MISFNQYVEIDNINCEEINLENIDQDFLKSIEEKYDFKKIANKAAKRYGSKEAGKKVAASIMWKAAKKAGADFSKVAKAARKGKDIELDNMKKYR